MGIDVPRGIYIHICGSDLVRGADGTWYVLEDNGRSPSGVSYLLENRQIMKRVFPNLFGQCRVRPVETYPEALIETLRHSAPRNAGSEPRFVLLTPGIHTPPILSTPILRAPWALKS